MTNLLKIVFLGVVGFALLVFFTAEKPKQVVIDEDVVNIVKYNSLPTTYELVGSEKNVSKEFLFEKNTKSLIVVGNHDSLAVIKEFPKYFKFELPYVIVSNISSAPWFVKKMFIPGKLEELNKDTNVPMIYDFKGDMVAALKLTDNSKTSFFAYLLNEDGIISKIYKGDVKEGALDGSMNEDEKKEALLPLYNLIK